MTTHITAELYGTYTERHDGRGMTAKLAVAFLTLGCADLQVYRQHRAALNGLDVRGRIYISPQGINAQYSGPEADALQYAQWVERQPEFQVSCNACGLVQCSRNKALHRLTRACSISGCGSNTCRCNASASQGLRWTQSPVQQHMFNRLRLAARPHLVSLSGGTAHLPITDPAARWRPTADPHAVRVSSQFSDSCLEL